MCYVLRPTAKTVEHIFKRPELRFVSTGPFGGEHMCKGGRDAGNILRDLRLHCIGKDDKRDVLGHFGQPGGNVRMRPPFRDTGIDFVRMRILKRNPVLCATALQCTRYNVPLGFPVAKNLIPAIG